MQALFKGEITAGTFYFKPKKKKLLLLACDLCYMNECCSSVLLPLPEIVQMPTHALISIAYFPIYVHFSLESPLGLEAQFLQCLV